MDPVEISSRIQSQLDDPARPMEASLVQVRDLTGTGDHFEASIVSKAFEGRSLVERHQMIYELFRKELAVEAIHAFTLKTLAPSEV